MVWFGAAATALVVLFCIASARVVIAPARVPGWEDVSHEPTKELILVHTISRHGERTPADTFPNDPHINDTLYPYGWGQLTNDGRLHMYRIGQYMRSRYDSFLGDTYSEKAVYARSTGANRARMSCALTLAGLWPSEGTPLDWNPNLDWQPIPVNSKEISDEDLLLMGPCPRYYEARDEVLEEKETRKLLDSHIDMFKDLSNRTGQTVKNFEDILDLYSTLKAEDSIGLKLPEWVLQYYPEKLTPITEEHFLINTYTDELKRLKGGRLLNTLILDWKAVVTGAKKQPAKISVYTGHDSTIADIGRALGVWDPQVPDYGATFLIELYRKMSPVPPAAAGTAGYFVEIYLQNSTRVEPFQLTIQGCSQQCPIEQVLTLRSHLVPSNWQEECQARNSEYVPPPPSGP